jgi:hypothetical protein
MTSEQRARDAETKRAKRLLRRLTADPESLDRLRERLESDDIVPADDAGQQEPLPDTR